MIRQTVIGIMWLLLMLVIISEVTAKDQDQMLKEVETTLQSLIEKQAVANMAAIEQLRIEINKKLAVKTNANPEFSLDELANMVSEIEYLRQEVALWKSFIDQNRAALATIEEGTIPIINNEEQISELQARLARLSKSINRTSAKNKYYQYFNYDEAPAWSDQLNISGFVDASDYNDHNTATASFGLDQVEIDIEKKFIDKAILRADVEYVSDGNGGFGMDLEQGYLAYKMGEQQHWTFTFGKFNAPIGFELLDAPDMYQYSHALVFDYSLPGNLTGFMIANKFTSVFDMSLYVVNGWDVNNDNNKSKTLGTRIGITPRANMNIGLSAIIGKEDDANVNKRTIYDMDMTYNPLDAWTIGLELNYGTEAHGMPDGSSGSWYGLLLMNNYEISDRVGITTRLDHFFDTDGLRTGTIQKWNAICISPSLSILDGLGGLFEIRYDWSDASIFTNNYGVPKDNQLSTAIEFTYAY